MMIRTRAFLAAAFLAASLTQVSAGTILLLGAGQNVTGGGGGGGLPAGVTLQAIDGESMTSSTTMTHNYYSRNGFTRVTAGTFKPSWDSTSFWPILSFYLDSHNLARAVDLGYNIGIDDVFGTQVWSNYDVSGIWHYSAQPGAGGPPNPASDFVAGWYTDEPVNDTIDQGGGSPLFYGSQPGTSIAGGPTLITQTSHSIAGGNFGSSQGSPPPGPPMTSVTTPNTFWTTPNPGSQHRGVDINGTDFYWFAYSTATSFRKPDCASMINHNFTSPECTTDQMARCSGYGNMVSAMRSLWFGNGAEPETVPATTPLGVFTENGAGNDSGNGSRNITAGEMTCSVWDAIIHGARATLYFYWVDVASLATNDPIYVATKSTNALLTAQAQMLNAPIAINYVTLTLSDGNTHSYVFPNWNSDVTTGWFGGGLDVMAKWYSNKFYILATTKYGESGYTTKTATFTVAGGGTQATVIYSSDDGSPSPIAISGGHFSDTFPHSWSVRIYRID